MLLVFSALLRQSEVGPAKYRSAGDVTCHSILIEFTALDAEDANVAVAIVSLQDIGVARN